MSSLRLFYVSLKHLINCNFWNKLIKMQTFSSTLILVIITLSGVCQKATMLPSVDERMELLSIVFRLAGAKEYVNNKIPGYTGDIDRYFAPYKDSELVNFTRKLWQTNGVSFDAVMSMAVNIEIKDGIRFKEGLSDESLDDRWGQKSAKKFIALLNGFYTESKFHEFFLSHSPLYAIAQANFSKLINQVDFKWFQSFYGGNPSGDFHLVVSLTNGGCNYGMKAKFKDGKEEPYAIIGTWKTDSLGQPVYSNDVTETIIHEYNHSFCNPLVDGCFKEMEPMAEKLYRKSSKILQKQAYGTAKTMTYEILVRSCVIRYYQEKNAGDGKIKSMLLTEKSKGFLWIDELVSALSTYENNRVKYPALKDFMPEIVKVQNGLNPDLADQGK